MRTVLGEQLFFTDLVLPHLKLLAEGAGEGLSPQVEVALPGLRARQAELVRQP